MMVKISPLATLKLTLSTDHRAVDGALGAEQRVEARVAGEMRGPLAVGDQDDLHAEHGAGCRRHARVIRLHPAAGDEHGGAGLAGLGGHGLHLPNLAATQAERQQVVTFHQEPRRRRPQRGPEPRQLGHGRRLGRERHGGPGQQGSERGGHKQW